MVPLTSYFCRGTREGMRWKEMKLVFPCEEREGGEGQAEGYALLQQKVGPQGGGVLSAARPLQSSRIK